jgi:hypothetical protein
MMMSALPITTVTVAVIGHVNIINTVATVKFESSFEYQVAHLFGMDVGGSSLNRHTRLFGMDVGDSI